VSAAAVLLAATLTVGSASMDALQVVQFPAGLEAHPTDPNRAFVAAPVGAPGVYQLQMTPGQPLAYAGAYYVLAYEPASCFVNPVQLVPKAGNFSLERGTGETRGWLTTSVCELAVPFDYATGAGWPLLYSGVSRSSVPARHVIAGSFTTYPSSGAPLSIASFTTNFTSAALRIGSRLVVASSNIRQSGSSPIWNPGTLLFFSIDDSGPTTTVAPASPFYAITSDPNPIALTELPGGRVAVTNAGLFDASFPPLVTGQGSIDVVDVASGLLVGSIPLGPGNPAGRSLALDPTGSVGVAGSTTLRQLVAVDVRGVAALPTAPVDARLQRPSCNGTSAPSAGGVPCLRERVIRGGANPIVLAPPPGSSGIYSYVAQVRFGASGNFLAATSFNDGGTALLSFDPRNLSRPHPLLPSRFGVAQTLAATAPAGQIGVECCPGPLLLHGNSAGGLAGSDLLFATGSPTGYVVRGHLGGTVPAASGDWDGDGVEDALDVCPVDASSGQLDSGGLATPLADGIGDGCQCGDPSDDGVVDGDDVVALRAFLAGSLAQLAAPEKCDVGGSSGCDLIDVVRLRRALAGASSGIAHVCAPFLP
jgi:hypothetical protein